MTVKSPVESSGLSRKENCFLGGKSVEKHRKNGLSTFQLREGRFFSHEKHSLIFFTFSGASFFTEEITSQIIYTEERGVFEKDEGQGLIVKTTGDVLVVVIVMGSGFSSLGGKICIKNNLFEKARPHRYSIGGGVNKSYCLL